MKSTELAHALNETCKKIYTPRGECILDIKCSLSDPLIMQAVGTMIIQCAAERNVLPAATPANRRLVVGMSSGGAVMEHSVSMASLAYPEHGTFHWIHYNNPDNANRNSLPLYGARPASHEAIIVDDVVRSGGALSTLHGLARESQLLEATAAIVLVDHSNGPIEVPDDLPLYCLFAYDDQNELFVPNAMASERQAS